MKIYIGIAPWGNHEREVNLYGTDKYYTLTQPHTLFKEDFYSVTRTVAVPNFPCFGKESYFHVYEISYFDSDNFSTSLTVDEDTACELLSTYAKEFLDGTACGCIEKFFQEKKQQRKYLEHCTELGEYSVEVTEMLQRIVTYPATSMKQAVAFAQRDYDAQRLILDAEDKKDVDFRIWNGG